MKHLLASLFGILLVFQVSAQNEPQFVQEFTTSDNAIVKFILIDTDMPKILIKHHSNFQVYNLDYTLYADIDFPESVDTTFFGLYLITRTLFDCDSTQLEYMVARDSFSPDESSVEILHQDGTELFSLEGYGEFMIETIENFDPLRRSVVSDASGSTIIFQQTPTNGDRISRIYHFCGQVPQLSARNMNGELTTGRPELSGRSGFSLYPNPGKDQIKIEYDLNGQRHGLLTVYNMSGQQMKQAELGPAFHNILLDISSLSAGSYIARITTDDGSQLSEKFLKVE